MRPVLHEALTGATPTDLDLSAIEDSLKELPGMLHDGTGGGEYGQDLLEARTRQSRRTRHVTESLVSSADQSFFPLAAEFILNPPPSVDAKAVVANILERRLPSRPDSTFIPAIFQTYVMFLAEEIQAMDQTASLVVNHLDEQTSNQPRAQYQLLRRLTHAGVSNEDTQNAKQDEVLLNLTTFAAIKPGRKDLISPIRQNLQDGVFDSFIADEILHEAFTDATGPRQERSNNDLLGLIALIKRATQLDDDQAAIGRLSNDLLELWPPSCRRLLTDRRNLYGQNLDANFGRHREHLITTNLISLQESTDTLDAALERFLAAIPKPPGSRTTVKDLAHNTSLERKRRRMQSRGVGHAAVTPNVEATAGQTDQGPRNQIMQMDAQGYEVSSDSPQFTEFVDDYVQKYKGTPGLAENIQAMIKYLAAADFSKGLVAGIRNYKRPVSRGGVNYNLFTFKPGGASGVRVSSEPARKTRILFVMPEAGQTADSNKLSLLAIVRIDDVPKYEKSLGIRSNIREKR